MPTLIWIEHDENTFHPTTLHLVNAALQLGQPVTALVIGNRVDKVAQHVACIQGIAKVLTAQANYYFPFRAEPIAKLLAHVAQDYEHILASATTTGKNMMPRMAALCHQPMQSDVVKIISPKTFVRPIYAGNALVQETFLQGKSILTIRASAFEKITTSQDACLIEAIEPMQDDSRSKVLSVAKPDLAHIDLQSARVVVSGGRGLGSIENFMMIDQLAQLIGAAVGASRAAVDAGYAPNDYQVGQTGKIVAPELYIAIGISGAIQHLAGMKDSKIIVALNKDPEAPIFEIADYGLVGDLFILLPLLIKEIEKLSH